MGVYHPGCFVKRGRKLLKTEDGSLEKRAKRNQEAANERNETRWKKRKGRALQS